MAFTFIECKPNTCESDKKPKEFLPKGGTKGKDEILGWENDKLRACKTNENGLAACACFLVFQRPKDKKATPPLPTDQTQGADRIYSRIPVKGSDSKNALEGSGYKLAVLCLQLLEPGDLSKHKTPPS